MAEIKSFLYAWLGKQKLTPCYDIQPSGSKFKPKFKCEVSKYNAIELQFSILFAIKACQHFLEDV